MLPSSFRRLLVATVVAAVSGWACDRESAGASTASVAVVTEAAQAPEPTVLRLPNVRDSVKFAAIGDYGTGQKPQYDVARQMAAWHQVFPLLRVGRRRPASAGRLEAIGADRGAIRSGSELHAERDRRGRPALSGGLADRKNRRLRHAPPAAQAGGHRRALSGDI